MVYLGLPIKNGGSFHGKLLVITRWKSRSLLSTLQSMCPSNLRESSRGWPRTGVEGTVPTYSKPPKKSMVNVHYFQNRISRFQHFLAFWCFLEIAKKKIQSVTQATPPFCMGRIGREGSFIGTFFNLSCNPTETIPRSWRFSRDKLVVDHPIPLLLMDIDGLYKLYSNQYIYIYSIINYSWILIMMMNINETPTRILKTPSVWSQISNFMTY